MTGVCPNQQLEAMIARGEITADPEVLPAQIQPASLDLRLGTVAYRVRASFLAGEGRTVTDRLTEFEMHRIDISDGAVLEKGCVYLVPLMESLALPRQHDRRGQRQKLDRAAGSSDADDHRWRHRV